MKTPVQKELWIINQIRGMKQEITKKNDWKEEWKGMPEYNNVVQKDPEITVTFKFRNKKDFDTFHQSIKTNLYNGAKVFDGMQRKDKKSTWYPLNQKASKFKYES